MKTIRITLLVENTAERAGLLAEHGLAYWIDDGSQQILFDTGQGGVLVSNAYRLGINLNRIDNVVLSHGHYDHTGGLGDALRGHRPQAIYLHPDALKPKYAKNQDGTSRSIGIPEASEMAIQRCKDCLVYTEKPTAVGEHLMVTGPVPRMTDFEDTGGPFFLAPECRHPDPLTDDQAIFFGSAEGTVVLLGCAHSGVINTLRYIQQLTDNRPICTVFGGMHLVSASSERLDKTIDALQVMKIAQLGPAHCTGRTATNALWNAMPEQCIPFHVGTQLDFH